MRTVVTGAAGMLGGAIYRELLRRREIVEGWSFSTERAPDGLAFYPFDLTAATDREYVFWEYLRKAKPELVINCAALTDADFCEEAPGYAMRVNAHVPGALATAARKMGARFIHISTDAIYDGSYSGLRKEEEQPAPLSVYAQTKLEGEGRALSAYPEALVLRTTMFGWTAIGKRPKLAEEILGALTARKPITLYRDAFFSPLHVEQLARLILYLAEIEVSGVLNVGAVNPVSKLHFGKVIADTFGLDPRYIEEGSVDDANLAAKRPKNVGLDVSVLKRLWGQPPSVESGIVQLYKEAFNGTSERIRGRKDYP